MKKPNDKLGIWAICPNCKKQHAVQSQIQCYALCDCGKSLTWNNDFKLTSFSV